MERDCSMKITIDYKKQLLDIMFDIYIKDHESEKDSMESLRLYSHNRLENCQNKDKRNFCSSCSIRCFSKNRREDIKRVMKYSGPRLIFYRPLALLRHTFNHFWRNLNDK